MYSITFIWYSAIVCQIATTKLKLDEKQMRISTWARGPLHSPGIPMVFVQFCFSFCDWVCSYWLYARSCASVFSINLLFGGSKKFPFSTITIFLSIMATSTSFKLLGGQTNNFRSSILYCATENKSAIETDLEGCGLFQIQKNNMSVNWLKNIEVWT